MTEDNPSKKTAIFAEIRHALAKEFTGRQWAGRLARWVAEAKQGLQELKKINQVVQNNYALGLKHYGLGNFNDAILRLKMVVWLEPNNAHAWYHLGLSYIAAEKPRDAKKALTTALKLKPDMAEAQEKLSSLA